MQKPGEDTSYPAIIDTGSSQLSIPPDVQPITSRECKSQACAILALFEQQNNDNFEMQKCQLE